MQNDKFLENIFTELSTIHRKLENFINCGDIKLDRNDKLYLELIDKRSCELGCLAGEIERFILNSKL